MQRHVLYLGEINSSQAAVWRKAIEVLDDDAGQSRTIALFPEDRCAGIAPDASVVQLRLSEMRLCRPRQWGACWLAGQLWQALQLDRFWADRLLPSRKGTQWDQILQAPVAYRLIAPGSEWKLHRDWFGKSAMADLLGADFAWRRHISSTAASILCCSTQTSVRAFHSRWNNLFKANFDVLLYDLTSTYFEINASDVAEGDKRRHGYSRDKRPDCPQVVIALVVTPDGLPLAYEVLPGNTADCTTLRMFLARIERQYGRARRVWVMDRGIPTEAVLAEMRGSDPPAQYLVGTPKGRLSRLEKQLLAKPWQEARAGVQVKLLAEDDELDVYAESVDRVSKERAMRRRQLKWLWKRLRELAAMEVRREEMLMKLGAARARAPAAWRLVDIEMDKAGAGFSYALNRQKLRRIRRRKDAICCAPTSPRVRSARRLEAGAWRGSAGDVGRRRAGECGAHRLDGPLDDLGRFVGQLVKSTLAFVASRDGCGGLANLGIHFVKAPAQGGGVGPAGEDLIDDGAVVAVVREGRGRPVVGGAETLLCHQRAIELLAELGISATLAHLREDGLHTTRVGVSGVLDPGEHGGAGAIGEALQGVERGLAGLLRSAKGLFVAAELHLLLEPGVSLDEGDLRAVVPRRRRGRSR